MLDIAIPFFQEFNLPFINIKSNDRKVLFQKPGNQWQTNVTKPNNVNNGFPLFNLTLYLLTKLLFILLRNLVLYK